MNLTKLLAPIAAAAAVTLAPAAHAAVIIQITDGTNVLTIADGSALDSDAGAGSVSWDGTFGTWSLAAAFGTSSANPLEMHLSAIVRGDRSDAPLSIRVTHTDLDAGIGPSPFWSFGGGAPGHTSATGSWTAYVDDDNNAFGTGHTIHHSSGYDTSSGSGSVGLTGTYSASIFASFDYSGIGSTRNYGSSMDVTLIPEPTSLSLLGLGLLGLGAARRRKA